MGGRICYCSYKSGDSYSLNGKLSEGAPLTAYQRQLRDHLDTALEKLPVYQGTVYRHYNFDDLGGREALLRFLGRFSPNKRTNLGGYLSVSTEPNADRTGGQYTVDMVIDAKTARSLNGFGANTEREAILARDVDIVPRSVERVGPYKFRITVEEYTNGSGELAAQRVQHLREGEQRREDMRGISGRYPVGVSTEDQGPAGREGHDARLSGVSADNQPAALDDAGMAAGHGGAETGRGVGSGTGTATENRGVNDGLGGADTPSVRAMQQREAQQTNPLLRGGAGEITKDEGPEGSSSFLRGAAPAVGTAESGGFCFCNRRSVKFAVTVDDRGVILLVNREVVYLAAVVADIALNTRVSKNNSGLERIIVAAPVTVGTPAEKMYTAVMLQRDPQTQRLYLHDAITEKELDIRGTEHLKTHRGSDTTNSELYTADILRNTLDVKRKMSPKSTDSRTGAECRV